MSDILDYREKQMFTFRQRATHFGEIDLSHVGDMTHIYGNLEIWARDI